jgi:hypothetical protein
VTDRPLDPADTLAWALHHNRCCQLGAAFDFGEADDLRALMAELGAHLAYETSLPTEAPRGVKTSDEAASNLEDLADRHWAVHWVHGLHPQGLTDPELVEQYESARETFNLPRQSASSLRSRRHELVVAGHLEPLMSDGKQVRRPIAGRSSTAGVWVARGSSGVSSEQGEAA